MRRRRIVAFAAVVAVVALASVVVHRPARLGVQALALLPSLFDAQVRPLEWVTGEPSRATVGYRPDRPGDLADLWLPSGATRERPVGGVVLVFGVNSAGRDHPLVVRAARAIARTGVAVFVPDSASLTAGRLEPSEINGVVAAVRAFEERPEVDRGRIGIVGFSVGGSLALIAAADPAIAGDLAFVNAFGAYGDAAEFLASIASQSYAEDRATLDWQPTRLAREVFVGMLLEPVSAADRALLAAPFDRLVTSGERPQVDPALRQRLGPAGRLAYDLATADDLAVARDAVARLPGPAPDLLAELSPDRHLDRIQTAVYLMHDVDDHHVPVAESRRLATGLAARGLLARFSEFRLFSHVQPDQVDPVAAAPELWKLALHLHALLTEVAA
jgi:predicted esterase